MTTRSTGCREPVITPTVSGHRLHAHRGEGTVWTLKASRGLMGCRAVTLSRGPGRARPACCVHRPFQGGFVQSRPLHTPRGGGSDGDGLTYLGEQLAQAQQRRRDDRVPKVRGWEQHPSNFQVNELERQATTQIRGGTHRTACRAPLC